MRESIAALARLAERCPGLLVHIQQQCLASSPLEENLIVSNAPATWQSADVLAALTALASLGALRVEPKLGSQPSNLYRATGSLESVVARVATVAEVLPALRRQFDEELQLALVVSWPATIPQPRFCRFRSSKLALIDMIDDAQSSATLVFPFVDDGGVEEIGFALVRALQRGVRVVLVTRYLALPDSPNARFAGYLRLAAADRHFRALNISSDSNPGRELLHAKVLVIDDGQSGYVGSANLTEVALGDAVEIGVSVKGAAARSIAALIDELISQRHTT